MRGWLQLLLMGCLVWGGAALAASPPIALQHTLEGQSVQADRTLLTYTLHVQNPGGAALSGVTLEFVPLLLVSEPGVVLEIASLAAGQEIAISFQVAVPNPAPAAAELARLPLHWAGTAVNASGAALAFPATSQQEVLP